MIRTLPVVHVAINYTAHRMLSFGRPSLDAMLSLYPMIIEANTGTGIRTDQLMQFFK